MKSFLAKKGHIEHKWHIVDADGAVLGRLAAKIAPVLMGKNKPTYTANVDTGDYVIVINAERVALSGNKADMKEYQSYSGYPGGQKQVSFSRMLSRRPEKVIELAVRRMLPKSSLGREMFRKLKVYRGSEHQHQAQMPEKLEI